MTEEKYFFCTNTLCRTYRQNQGFVEINDKEIILKQANGEYNCMLRWHWPKKKQDSTCETIESLNNQSKLLKKLDELLNKDKIELEDTEAK